MKTRLTATRKLLRLSTVEEFGLAAKLILPRGREEKGGQEGWGGERRVPT